MTTENPTGQIVRDYLAMLGVNVEIVVSTDNVETVREMVEEIASRPEDFPAVDPRACILQQLDRLHDEEMRALAARKALCSRSRRWVSS